VIVTAATHSDDGWVRLVDRNDELWAVPREWLLRWWTQGDPSSEGGAARPVLQSRQTPITAIFRIPIGRLRARLRCRSRMPLPLRRKFWPERLASCRLPHQPGGTEPCG